MLTFLSAFLGLVIGVQPVELTVSGEIAAVELRLDGETVGRMEGEPWKLPCDFGSELAPHELTAIGYDSEGREITRATRWLNLPQPRSRAEVILLGEATDGTRRARLVAHSADGVRPDAWQVRFDGEPLLIEDPNSFELPPHDPKEIHFLQAELRFGRSMAHTERIVGGQAGDAIDTELTAYVVALDRGKLPSTDEMQGWLLKDGEPLEVVSIERGGADIVLVQEATPRLWGSLNRLRRDSLNIQNRGFANRLMFGLRAEDRLRVILPVGELAEGAALEQFHISRDFADVEEGPTSSGATRQSFAIPAVQGILSALPYPPEGALREDVPRRMADAVAVAAQAVSAARRARVVVLVRDSKTKDYSAHNPDIVRRYLQRLNVPLVVWSSQSGRRIDKKWGEAQDIATINKFRRAVIHLRRVLDRQVVVWVRGRHLPQEIELSGLGAQRFSTIESSAVPLPEEAEEEMLDQIAEAENAPDDASAEDLTVKADTPEAVPAPATPPETVIAAEEPAMHTDAPVDVVEVRLVELHVTASNQQDGPVRDLRREDFTIYEDGKPVEVQYFTAPTQSAPTSSDPAAAPPEGASANDATEESPSHLVIFLDALHLDSRGRRDLAASLREVLGQTGALRTMVATYDRSLKIPLPFTSDRLKLTKILEEIEKGEHVRPPGRSQREEIERKIPEIENALRNALDPLDRRMAEAQRDALLVRLRGAAEALSNETEATLDVLRDLTLGLGGIEGRKILLYAGAGLEMSPIADLYDEAAETLELNPREIASLRSESESFRSRGGFDDLLQDAHATEVTFYGLTPRTRSGGNIAQQSRTSTTRPGAHLRLASARQERVREAICLLSGDSGGRCQVGGSNPELLLEQLAEDLSAGYTLAFTPPHSADGSFHRLKVEVNRPGVKVRHREGYTDRQPSDRLHDRLASALFFGVEENALGMTIEVGEEQGDGAAASKEGENTPISLDVRFPVERLGLQPLGQGTELKAKARLLITTLNGNGSATEIREYPIAFQIDTERLQAQPPVVYSHEVKLLLEPGEHTVAIGVWDEISELGAFLRQEIVIGKSGS